MKTIYLTDGINTKKCEYNDISELRDEFIKRIIAVGGSISIGDHATIFNYAVINSFVTIGENTLIGERAVIKNSALIGNNVIIKDGAFIGEDAFIGDNAKIGKGAIIGDAAIIGNNVMIGDNILIKDNRLIEDGVIILSDEENTKPTSTNDDLTEKANDINQILYYRMLDELNFTLDKTVSKSKHFSYTLKVFVSETVTISITNNDFEEIKDALKTTLNNLVISPI